MRLLSIQIILILLIGLNVHAQRGRVQIQDGTIVTDTGTLLRGAYIALESPPFPVPERKDISYIKELGLNSLHVYAENFWDINQTHPGYNMDKIDSLVTWTAEDSLYLILTFAGGITENNDSIIEFIKDCWELYADRYKDETHLVYEIYNEPGDVPYDSVVMSIEKEVYQIIRAQASETHVLLMSPWTIYYDEIFDDLNKLYEVVNWSNASLGIHTYNRAGVNIYKDILQDPAVAIQEIKDSGYAVTVTEFLTLDSKFANLALTRIFEQKFVSYLHFLELTSLQDPAVFRHRIQSSELRWIPDFGTWPLSISEISYNNPYQYWKAGLYDEGLGWLQHQSSPILTWLQVGSYAAYYYLDFGEGPTYFEVECASDNGGGTIEIHLDSIDGPMIGECIITNTGDWEDYEIFSCDITYPYEGVHSIYLIFDISNLPFNVKSWKFYKSNPNSLTSRTVITEKPRLYPNPAKDFITLNGNGKGLLEIYSIYGQLMIRKELSEYENTIPIYGLSNGSYIVKISNNLEIHSEILIIDNNR